MVDRHVASVSSNDPAPSEGGGRERGRSVPGWALYWVGAGPLFIAALVDVPRLWSFGSISGLGAVTVAEAVVSGVVLLWCALYPRRVLKLLSPYGLFLVWAVASVSWAPPDVKGYQNLAAYLLFGTVVMLGATLSALSDTRAERVIEWGVRFADVGGLGLVAVSFALRGWPTNIDRVPWLVHPRGVALMGLAPLAWHLARWYYGRERALVVAALWLLAIFISLSRMATATACLLLALVVILHRRFGTQRRISRVLLPGLGLAVLLAAATWVGPFHDRIFRKSPLTGETVGLNQIDLNESDRPKFWSVVIASGEQSPVIGQGLGSSQNVVSERFPWVGHPHNDYLRVWHDLGLIGIIGFLVTIVIWLRALWRGWRSAETDRDGSLGLAGLLALTSLLIPMLTDNPLMYSFVIGPVGLILGAGLGAGGLTRPAAHVAAPVARTKTQPSFRPWYKIERRRRRKS